MKKSTAMLQTFGFALLKSTVLLCYLYWNQGNPMGFWRLLSGGLEVSGSKEILYVTVWIFPDFLFYHYGCSRYVRQLKDSYVFIFVREKNMKIWLRKFTAVTFGIILMYEAGTVLLLFLAGTYLQADMEIPAGEFAIMVLCQLVRLAVVVIFCNLLLFRFREMVAVYANLLVQAFPLLSVGVLYDANGAWDLAVKYIPFNWCNYNYLAEVQLNPFILLFLSAVLGVLLYLYSEKLFDAYERI